MHEKRAAFGGVVKEALVRAGKVGAQLVGAHTDDDSRIFRKVVEGQRLRIEQVHLNAEHAQGVGNGLAFRGDVADVEILRHGDDEGVNQALCRLRPELRGQRG